tara:strand:- start:924 stop:1148 length:225 start_codon:yes stop_codon:yes gene_type:complete
MVESILTYALGQTIEFSDSNDIEQILNKLKADDYRMRSMIREIATNKPDKAEKFARLHVITSAQSIRDNFAAKR